MFRIIEITIQDHTSWGLTIIVAILASIGLLLLGQLGVDIVYGDGITQRQRVRGRRVVYALVLATMCILISDFQMKIPKENVRTLDSSEYNLHITKDNSKLYLSNPDGRNIQFELGDTSYTTRTTTLNVKSYDGAVCIVEVSVPNQSGASDTKMIEVPLNVADYKIQHN